MPAPIKYPDWATDGTNTVEPPAGKVAAGWLPAEQPPAGWFNWWKHLVGQWTRWLDAEVVSLTSRIGAVEPVAADAARKSVANTFNAEGNLFAQGLSINVPDNVPDYPLLTTTGKPGDYPANPANRWKLVMAIPTQGTAWAGIFVGQSPYGAALVNNARWHLGEQKWRQLDPAYPSTAMVGRTGQWVCSFVPAGAAPWADWPFDGGGDFIAGGNVGAHSGFVYVPAASRADWTIPLSCSSGETFMQSDGSYKVGTAGASWPLKVPDTTVLSNIYVLYESASAALAYAALVRRSKGVIVVTPTFPTFETVASANSIASIGTQTITLATAGHVAETASWEYSIIFKRAHQDDRVGRIALNAFVDGGPRNLG